MPSAAAGIDVIGIGRFLQCAGISIRAARALAESSGGDRHLGGLHVPEKMMALGTGHGLLNAHER
jgi:hypothetical protein